MKLSTKSHRIVSYPKNLPGWAVFVCLCLSGLYLLSCNNGNNVPPHQEIVAKPEQMNEKVPDIIKNIVAHIAENGGKIDSIAVLQSAVLPHLYEKSNEAKWSKEEKWLP